MMRRTSTSGRLSCLVWAQPSSAAAMRRSKRSDTDFFLSLGFPLKKEPSHCFITLSIFSVLKTGAIYISRLVLAVPLTEAWIRTPVFVSVWRGVLRSKQRRSQQVLLPVFGTFPHQTQNVKAAEFPCGAAHGNLCSRHNASCRLSAEPRKGQARADEGD